MKNYTITVNGNVYDVTVEENGNGAAAAPVAAPKAAPKAASKAAPKAAAGAGSIKVEAGQTLATLNYAVLIVEAMKMEIPVVAPEDGTVASIDVAVGDAVEAGQTLATLN